MHTQGSFCWRECGTRDAAAARAFYGELFGWQAVEHPMPGEAGVYTILKRGEQDVAGLYEMTGPQFEGIPPHWATYVAHDDVDAAVAKARAQGAEVLGGPFDIPDVGRMAVLRDPQGAVIQLLKSAGSESAEVVDFAPGTFCWSELVTTDPEGAGSFYTGLVGWNLKTEEAGAGTGYTEFLQGDRPVGGMMKMEGDQWRHVPPHWMNYVSVEDTDAVTSKAKELGGNVIVPPTDIPNVGRFATLQDPTGAAFSVIALALPKDG